jgi:sulfofructose kinase
MRTELAGYGVDATHLRLFQGACSSVSSVVVDASGERMLVNFRGADLPGDPAWLPLDTVCGADIVLADPRWPEGALALFAQARSAGVPSILDGDVAEPAVFDALLPHVDYAVFSSEGLACYVDRPHHALDIEKALGAACAKGCRVAAVTLGDRGVAWLDGTTIRKLPAFAVDVVDTNGAGDVFHGALAFALGARWHLRDALLFSSAAAALKCTSAGPRNGIPDFASTMSFLGSEQEVARRTVPPLG